MTGPVEPPAGEGVSAALRRASTGEQLGFRDVLDGIGGPLGIAESLLPTFAFLVVYTPTKALLPAVIVAVALAAVFLGIRLVRRQQPTAAVGGLVAFAVSAVLAAVTGKPSTFFLPGILINAAYGLALAVSIAVRWPLIGVVAGLVTGDARGWRTDPARRRVFTWLTALWVGLFALRLLLELPLYLAGPAALTALGVVRLVTGVPLFALVVLVTLLAVQAVQRRIRSAPAG